jgi:HEAT repeat protein
MRLFFGPKIKHPDEQVRLKALSRIDDETALIEVAATDASPAVRLSAARKIRNPGRLAELVDRAKQMDVILDAVGRIRDPKTLARIILDHKNLQIMHAAFEGITDPRVLEDIAQDSRYSVQARRLAIDNYADQAFLNDVSSAAPPPKAAGSPPEKELNTENIQALVERYGGARLADAIGKFRGSERAVRSLGLIARNAADGRSNAIRYLDKALDHSNPHIRRCALEELSTLVPDPSVAPLLSRMKNDPDPLVQAAYEKLPSR